MLPTAFRIGARSSIQTHYPLRSLVRCRFYSGPPLKSYHGLKSPLSLIWARSPSQLKVFTGVLATGLAIANLHPSTIVTLGPPLGVLSWYSRKWYEKEEYTRLVNEILPSSLEDFERPDQRISLARYDETDVDTAIKGFDDEFLYFKKQILEIVEQRIVDYIAVTAAEAKHISKVLRPLVDENKQVVVHLGQDLETFVTTRAEVLAVSDDTIVNFTKLSVPYYDSKNAHTRKRLGTVEVSLLEIPSENQSFQDYRISVRLVQNKIIGGATERIGALPGHNVQKSLFCK
uniref:Uncharacterized protein n=1 Tax=Candidozyma auris TaxID=498019 RepID=A0A0L0NW31_CANAR